MEGTRPSDRQTPSRLYSTFLKTFDLGLTSFGGPPVHFQTFRRRFVESPGGEPWISEQTYQELFAVSQALPGSASANMLFNIVQIHSGVPAAIMVMVMWSIPAAIVMYGLSLGVSKVGERLPGPVYAFFSGLNSATVGLIALAAVQLARKAINDKITRLLVAFGACAAMCYNALWYFPVLLVVAGAVTAVWDLYLEPWISLRRSRANSPHAPTEPQSDDLTSEDDEIKKSTSLPSLLQPTTTILSVDGSLISDSEKANDIETYEYRLPVKVGIIIVVLYFAFFAAFMAVRGALLQHSDVSIKPSTFLLSLFTNMLLAGTIIFGGGPVAIPLMRDYVVAPGWVSPRDFLLGLAVIQAMPGPNFNFAIYLGALAVGNKTSLPSVVGAILAFIGIYAPGMWLAIGLQSIWQSLRKHRGFTSVLRGVNAGAVGFVFAAVYRLWEIGYLTVTEKDGTSLGREPWWISVAVVAFIAVERFSIPPPVAILSGGVAGLAWWGVVGRH